MWHLVPDFRSHEARNTCAKYASTAAINSQSPMIYAASGGNLVPQSRSESRSLLPQSTAVTVPSLMLRTNDGRSSPTCQFKLVQVYHSADGVAIRPTSPGRNASQASQPIPVSVSPQLSIRPQFKRAWSTRRTLLQVQRLARFELKPPCGSEA